MFNISKDEKQNKLIELIAELKEEEVLNLIKKLLEDGVDPLTIIDLSHKGMIRVGELFEKKIYYISGLIMAGEIMRQIGQLILPLIEGKVTNRDSGNILIGTVEGDIHFIGKDIFKVLARAYGFNVHDLGVDVPPSKFLSAIYEFNPDIVGLSCLISGAFENMSKTINFLKKNISNNLLPRAYIIGGRVDEIVCKDVGADYWTNDGMEGVRLCQKIMAGN
jgi:methanogenic corrinoid protein MtbC1